MKQARGEDDEESGEENDKKQNARASAARMNET
jgi:hypothetical protein